MKGPLVQEESATNEVEEEDKEAVLVEETDVDLDVVLVVLTLLVDVLVEEVEGFWVLDEDVVFLTARKSRWASGIATAPFPAMTAASTASVRAKKAEMQYL